MGSTIRNRIVLALLSVFILGLLPASAQTLVHQYDLTTSLTDSVNGNSLLADGGTLIPGTGYQFGPGNEGLRLENPLLGGFGDEYAIELTFYVDAANPLNDFHKIVDFDTGFNDAGFYVSTGGTASFVELFPTVSSGPGGVSRTGFPQRHWLLEPPAGRSRFSSMVLNSFPSPIPCRSPS